MASTLHPMVEDSNGHAIQAVRPNPGRTQRVSIGASSTASSAFNSRLIRVMATVDCFIETGTNPTASIPTGTTYGSNTGSAFLPAGVIEYLRINGNDRVAVIQSTTAGYLYVSEAV